MSETTPFEAALALALKLPVKERLQLIRLLAESIERELDALSSNQEKPSIESATPSE